MAKYGTWIRHPNQDCTVIFIHGLNSSNDAWKNKNGTFWPDLIKNNSELASIGIYTFEYYTGINSGSYSVSDAVDALRECLVIDKVIENQQHLIFVTHSMGGIIARRFIVSQMDLLKKSSVGIIGLFLVSSPSLGSDYANNFKLFQMLLNHSQIKVLEFSQNNLWLNDLDKDFMRVFQNQSEIPIYGKELYEDSATSLFKLFSRNQIVQPFSASRYFADSIKIPQSDHFSIAKPDSEHAFQHTLLVQFILDDRQRATTLLQSSEEVVKKSPPKVWLPTNKSELCQKFEIELHLRGIITSSEYATDYDYYVAWFNEIEPDQADHRMLSSIETNSAQHKAAFSENPATINQAYAYIYKTMLIQSKLISNENTAQTYARNIAKQLISTKFKHNSDSILIRFQSERAFDSIIEADLALDWNKYQQGIKNNMNTWERGQQALYDLFQWIGSSHRLILNTQGLGYFPALMFGSIFYSATSYNSKVLNYDNEWKLLLAEDPSDNLECNPSNPDYNSKNCIVCICITNTQPSNFVIDEMNKYSRKYIENGYNIINIYPKDNKSQKITDSKHISSIINFIIDALGGLPKRYQNYHLIISAPVALVVLLGQRLNGYQSWFLHEYIKTPSERPEQDHYYRLIDFPIVAQADPNR
ncbi:alpha/beta fold hydrolase [Herpetosiphon llansteffanensis]